MKVKTPHEIHDEGIDALGKTPDPVDRIRFIQMFDQGTGDYTKERKQLLSKDLDEIFNDLLEMQKQAKSDSGAE